MSRFSFAVGDKIGYYEVIAKLPRFEITRRYKLKCICGNYRELNHDALRRILKYPHNCGCITLKLSGDARRLTNNKAVKRMIYNRYIYKASRRGYSFELTFNFFESLITCACYYCNALPTNMYTYDSDFRYNGIDRVDNTKGYIEGNVVSCCKTCNAAKGTMTTTEFLDWISRIYNNMKGL